MSMNALVNDLRFAQTAGVRVQLHLLDGERLLKGVHDVNEEEGYVSLFAPKMLGNDPTTMKVALDLIARWSVTDTPWKEPE